MFNRLFFILFLVSDISTTRKKKGKIDTCIEYNCRISAQEEENEFLCTRFFFNRCLFIQLLILHSLSYIHLLSLYTYNDCYDAYFLLTKDDYIRSFTLSHTFTFARRESLSPTHDVVVNVYIFFLTHCCCSVQPILTCSFRTREREVQRVDKLLTLRMHLCMFFVFFCDYALWVFFYILSIFLFFWFVL